nr:phage tail tape measure protein [Natronocella acetinitrilica]
MDRSLQQVQRTARRLTGIIAGLAGAAGLQALIRQSINAADEIGKLGQRTGETAEFLSTLAFAAEQNDASLRGVSTGLRNLASQLDAAAQGGTAQLELFRRLGVEATNTDGSVRGVGETLFDVADAFQQLESPTQRAALAQELFGRSGEELIPLLLQGSEGIQQLQADAARYGREISGRLAQRAERFNDQLNILRSRAQGAGLTLADAVLPVLIAVTEEFDNAAENGTGFQTAIDGLSLGLRTLVLGARGAIFGLEVLGSTIAAVAAAATELAQGNFGSARDILWFELDRDVAERFDNFQDFYDRLFRAEEDLADEIKGRQRLRDAETTLQAAATDAAEEQEAQERRITDAIRDRGRELDEAKRRAEDARRETEELEKLFAGLRGEAEREGRPETVLDVQRLRAEADRQLRDGDLDGAIESAREAARIIEALQRDDELENAGAATVREIERIALEAARAREAAAQDEVQTIEQQIEALQGQLDGLKGTITLDDDELAREAQRARDFLEQLFLRNPLQIPVIATGEGGDGAGLPVRHSGGVLPGSGESVFVGLGGEGVVNRQVMSAIGESGLNDLNRMRLPEGLAGQQGGGRAVHLHMGGRDYPMTAEADVADQVERFIRREALKRGGPR